jgi:hypothetical protein
MRVIRYAPTKTTGGRIVRRKGTRRTGSRRPAGRAIPRSVWEKYSDDQLLDTRICDLGLKVESDSWLWPKVEKLYTELEARGLGFRPHVWLSDEWFSPDGVPGIAIPFCLAHPRLRLLERNQMMEVEGGTSQWCMRILRHETGHTIDTAYRLHRRRSYKRVFGNYHDPYPDSYRPKPNSKRYVMHLEPWYAQSHPAEDFAETFAVWLKPRSPWRSQYEGWPALKKIKYVDELMAEIAGESAPVKSRVFVDPVSQLTHTLREHYEDRHSRYATRQPGVFDHDLLRLFSRKPRNPKNPVRAAEFLQRNRADLIRVVCQWTGEYRYSVHQVMRQMIERCRQMNLFLAATEAETRQRAMVLLTVHTMNYLHGGHHRVAL